MLAGRLFSLYSDVLADCLCILASSDPSAEHLASAKLAASLTTARVPASLSCLAVMVRNVAAQDEAVCSTRHSIAANLCWRLLLVLFAPAASCCTLLIRASRLLKRLSSAAVFACSLCACTHGLPGLQLTKRNTCFRDVLYTLTWCSCISSSLLEVKVTSGLYLRPAAECMFCCIAAAA